MPIRFVSRLIPVYAALLAVCAPAGAQRTVEPIAALFENRVRPVLLASCVSCHNKETHQGNLRLDAPITADQARTLLLRVKGEGGKPRMPLGAALSGDKIAAIESWVKRGALWPAGKSLPAATLMERGRRHWAFQPISHPAPPAVRLRSSVSNPIDSFILHRLERKGIAPSPPASKSELIRRVTYDLTGLPPTPEEVAAFEADRSPDAYNRLIDRLLASPHYGEKWGRHWLDLVRYAETNSYERDNPKPHVTQYRDYVIRAFNSDKPYDRFLREQIAGDEMGEAVGDAIVGTAYYRLGIWDDEPADLKQATYDDLDDLVATTGQALLGLTMDCARCHDHKLDPIPQKDYYRFAALFRNVTRFANGGPTDEKPFYLNSEQKHELDMRAQERDRTLQAARERLTALDAKVRAAHAAAFPRGDLENLNYRCYEGAWNTLPDFEKERVVANGVASSGLIDLKLRRRPNQVGFLFEGALSALKEGDYTFHAFVDDGIRITINGARVLERAGAGSATEPLQGKIHLKAGRAAVKVELFAAKADHGAYIAWSGPSFTQRALTTMDSSGAASLRTVFAANAAALLDHEDAQQYAALCRQRDDLEKLVIAPDLTLCVSEHGDKAPDTFVLVRGNPTAEGDRVEPGFPQCAGGAPTISIATVPGGRSTGRRTALANWLVAPENPLVARVIVNRVWQHHFGRGIVRTPNDFGLQGAPPTHPELLDWLAQQFVHDGWSFKKLHRLILTSSAYRQSSRPNPIALKADPMNDLFWRFDMRRLTAEEIRDTILAASGNINLEMFGDCVYPEIPMEILASQSRPGNDWNTDQMKPGQADRRSIYIHVKRSLVYPLLAGFDLPDTDRPAAARFASTQPTQALSLINGPFTNKQAGILANRIGKEVGVADAAFARRLLSLVLQRSVTEREVREAVALLGRLRGHGAKPDQARLYLCLAALNLNEMVYLD